MTSPFRKLTWWLRRRRKEEELREELQFHLSEELDERRAEGWAPDEARRAARRDLGNVTLVQEDVRRLWTWTPLEQLGQDLRYGLRTMRRSPAFTALVALSLALGIGANTAIYSFMDAILWRALPVSDPAALAVVTWRSRPVAFGRSTSGPEFVLHSIDGSVYSDEGGANAAIFPFAAFERLQEVSAPLLSSLFGYFPAGNVNVVVNGAAEIVSGEYVSGDFFRGLGLVPAAGRFLTAADDREGATAVAVISMGYCRRAFGDPASATGQTILVNNTAFTVVGVTPPGFFGVDPGAAPHLYFPLHADALIAPGEQGKYRDPNYYWLGMMARLRPGVSQTQAQAVLAPVFAQWVATTATSDAERANLPQLRLEDGLGGLDSLRRQYSHPLYVLLGMVALILAIACANTANLLLARATARRREIAVRLSIGASRGRIVRQLLTESVLVASLGGALGVGVAVLGMRVLTRLLANGRDGFTLHAELNWHVLAATLGLSVLCGIVFGLAPALQSARRSVTPALKGTAEVTARASAGVPHRRLSSALVVAQVAISLLLLVGAALFVRTLSNLHSIQLGFDRDRVLLFEVDAPQAGRPASQAVDFYAGLRQRLSAIPGVRDVTLSHASLIRAGRAHPVTVDDKSVATRVLYTGPGFFTTMRIPLLRGREIDEHDRAGGLPVAVVSEAFAKQYLGGGDALGRHVKITITRSAPMDLEVVGVAGTVRYGGLKRDIPPVLYIAYAQVPPARQGPMTYAIRTDGDPLAITGVVRGIVHDADARVPVTNIRTQVDDIDRTINQEIVFARLCSTFAGLALIIACVGLYGTMSYTVARRTREIGIRMALGARRGTVVWMVLREVCLLAALGLAISIPIALVSSRLIASFLFAVKPNDPAAVTLAAVVLVAAALVAGYGPSRRASRVEPMIALRHE